MALSNIVTRIRSVLYGHGLGEKPAFRIAAANANESVSGSLVTFSLASGEGSKVKAGNVLSVYSPASEGGAHVIYVTSVASDAVTGINGYMGSPVVDGSDSGDLDSALLEQNPLVSMYEIYEAVDTVVARFLWPDVYTIEQKTIASPDLVDGQEAVATDVMEIISAWQIIGPTAIKVPFDRTPWDVATDVASTGRMARFDWIDGGTGYYTAKTKITEADEASEELTHLIATGAAAILLGASMVDTTIQGTKKDNAEAVSRRQAVGNLLWRDFLTLKQEYSRELGRRLPQQILINRG